MLSFYIISKIIKVRTGRLLNNIVLHVYHYYRRSILNDYTLFELASAYELVRLQNNMSCDYMILNKNKLVDSMMNNDKTYDRLTKSYYKIGIANISVRHMTNNQEFMQICEGHVYKLQMKNYTIMHIMNKKYFDGYCVVVMDDKLNSYVYRLHEFMTMMYTNDITYIYDNKVCNKICDKCS